MQGQRLGAMQCQASPMARTLCQVMQSSPKSISKGVNYVVQVLAN